MPKWLRNLAAVAATIALITGCGIAGQSPGPGGTTRPTGGGGPTPPTTTSRPTTSGPGASATTGVPATPSATATTGATATPGVPATPEVPLATPTGRLRWANWPNYMQFQPNQGGYRLLNLFEEQHGIE